MNPQERVGRGEEEEEVKEILLKLKHPGAQTRGCPERRMGDRVSGCSWWSAAHRIREPQREWLLARMLDAAVAVSLHRQNFNFGVGLLSFC